MLFPFTNITAEILQHILYYSFCAAHLYLGAFLPNAFAIKNIKNYFHKSWSALAQNMSVKLTPWHQGSPYLIFSRLQQGLSPGIQIYGCSWPV